MTDCKSQNTKNEQQKDLCITSEQLTDKWNKGELPCGWYYIKIADIVFIDFFEGKVWKNKKDEYIDEVLAPLPSYGEWKAKDDAITCLLVEYGKLTKELQDEKEKHMARPSLRSPADEMVIEKQVWASTLNRSMELQAENAQLKELLKECRHLMQIEKDFASCHFEKSTLAELVTKINQVLGEE